MKLNDIIKGTDARILFGSPDTEIYSIVSDSRKAVAGAAFFALGALDVTLLFAKQGQLKNLWEMIMNFLNTMDKRLVVDGPTLASFAAMMLSSWFGFVTLTYLADVISSALLNGKKMNGPKKKDRNGEVRHSLA